MVGVPGRSKACVTCIARKKGCDKKTPSCGQCIKAALVCGGYTREHVWVGAKKDQHRVKATYTGTKELEYSKYLTDGAGALRNVALHDSLVISAREENLIGLYWESYLPDGRPMTSKASSLSAGGWITFLGNLNQAEPTLRYAIYATSCTMLGVRDGNDELRIKGLQTYNSSLKELAKALKNPKRATSDGLLAAVRVMGSYQVLFGRDAADFESSAKGAQIDGWNGHSDGELALAELRGPGGFTTPAGHQLFADGLMNAITNCMSRRKRTQFEQPCWRTGPWIGRSKTLKDQLLDIVIDVPGYIEDFDNIKSCADQNEMLEKRLDLLQRCRRTDRARLSWEMDAAHKIQRFDYKVTGLPVPGLLKGEDLSVLHLTCFYWAICIQLHVLINDLLGEVFAPHQNKHLPQSTRFSHIDPEGYAHKIAHCVHLHFDPRAGGLGANLGVMPLAFAWYHLENKNSAGSGQQTEELRLLRQLFEKPPLGLYVGRFLESLRCRVI